MKGSQIPTSFAFWVIAALIIVAVIIAVMKGGFFPWMAKVFPVLAGSLPFT